MTNQPNTNSSDESGITSRVFKIDFVRKVHSCQAADYDFKHDGRAHTPLMLAIVGEALDAGVFYEDQFKDACRDKWDAAFPCVDACLTASAGRNWIEPPEDLRAYQAAEPYREALKSAPRGTWALFRSAWPDNRGYSWMAFVADGRGGFYEPHLSHLGREPSHKEACDSMVGMDIYLARRAETERRECVRGAEMIRELGWRLGSKVKDLKLGSKEYSSAVITGISGDGPTGASYVTLELSKRGSRNRWTWTGHPQFLTLKALPAPPAYGALTVEPGSHADLFAA